MSWSFDLLAVSALEDEATSDYKRHFDNLEFSFLMNVLRDLLTSQG